VSGWRYRAMIMPDFQEAAVLRLNITDIPGGSSDIYRWQDAYRQCWSKPQALVLDQQERASQQKKMVGVLK